MRPDDEMESYIPAHARCPAWLEAVCAAVVLACCVVIGWHCV